MRRRKEYGKEGNARKKKMKKIMKKKGERKEKINRKK